MANILIIGVRRPCYRAALSLGHQVVLWGDGVLHESRKKHLKGWIEIPYLSCKEELSSEAKRKIDQHDIEVVIANTEEAVVLGSRVRRYLGLKRLAIDVAERFHNKWVMKKAAAEIGMPMTKFQLIDETTTANDLIGELGLPLVIKPVDESGAQDVGVAKTHEDVERLKRPGLLAEAFVQGPEVSVETFIENGKPIFHNMTDYLHQWRKSLAPADHLEPGTENQILSLNDQVIHHFGIDRGMTHAEFYLTAQGPLFGEVAVRPPGGYYMSLIDKVYGFDPWKTYVKLECGESVGQLPCKPKGYASAFMFHPGRGKIKLIQGVEEVRKEIPGIFELKIRKKAGDEIAEHENTSNEVGHILFSSPSRKKALEEIALIESTIRFEMF